MAPAVYTEKKGHVCPTSNATHPSDRWESLFVYSFICKFTNLRGKTEGLDTPMDFENALMSREPNPILTQLLCNFILNLKPQTRNLSADQISTTVVTVLSDYFKSSERTVFWNDDLKRNVDPFEHLEGGFFAADWRFKLIILRQLVELQLSHSPAIKDLIDRAWGVVHHKHKKKDASTGRLEPSDPCSQENLQLVPLGQDRNRKRYWVADGSLHPHFWEFLLGFRRLDNLLFKFCDSLLTPLASPDSPRVYVSTNPWKITATFQTVSSTREEYLSVIEQLKNDAPGPLKKGEKRSRSDQGHLTLVEVLENRIVAIDAEIARVQRVKRKLEQRRTLLAQAELRETRTRRRTQRPDYVYSNGIDSQDDADDYNYEEASNDYDDEDSLNSRTNGLKSKRNRDVSSLACRRSTRTAMSHTNGKRESSSDSWQWGERRSTRQAAKYSEADMNHERPQKRARTVESVESASPAPADSNMNGASNGIKMKRTGAAALKPTEIAMEQVAGKKKSKYWVYAVEPMAGGPVNDHQVTMSPSNHDRQNRLGSEANSMEVTPDALQESMEIEQGRTENHRAQEEYVD